MNKIDKYLNEMRDEENPDFLFQTVATSILLNIINKRIDPMKLAKKELANRGLDKRGNWIGFKEAEKLWKV